MKFAYITKNFSPSTLGVIDQANVIIDELMADGYTLTLRQLYYQFVARDLFANKQTNYDRLGRIVSDGRLAGLIDWDAIVDRTRNLESNSHWDSVADILRSCAYGYRRDVWADQPNRVEVWIEKQALIGIIEKPCVELDVPFFACRGYVSQSEQREAGIRAFQRHQNRDQHTVILHLGDHDPSGMDMTRDNSDRLTMFSSWDAVTVKRIALNMDQVDEYSPPPNPTKLTDSRAPQYIQKYGYDSWELDALSPKVLDALIRSHVDEYVDHDLMEAAIEEQEAERQIIVELADQH